jgi:uncharacterized protein (UPF0248 family)
LRGVQGIVRDRVHGHIYKKLSSNPSQTGEYKIAFKGKESKIPVTTIVKISKEKMFEEKNKVLSSEKTVDAFCTSTRDIVKYTQAIIDARQSKRDQPINQLLRGAGYVLAAISSVILIGIPFLIMLRREDETFKKEMEQLKSEIETMRKLERDVIEIGQEREKMKNSESEIKQKGALENAKDKEIIVEDVKDIELEFLQNNGCDDPEKVWKIFSESEKKELREKIKKWKQLPLDIRTFKDSLSSSEYSQEQLKKLSALQGQLSELKKYFFKTLQSALNLNKLPQDKFFETLQNTFDFELVIFQRLLSKNQTLD